MNTSALKTFAPAVRTQLIEAITRKLDFVLTGDTADLRAASAQRAILRREAERDRSGLIERVAYTWFNRFAALRFIDARGWHPFHARVLTSVSADETQPELLKLIRSGALPEELKTHLDETRLNDLLDGRIPSPDAQGEVYRHLVLGTCRFYHDLLPDLFEKLDDETELLLPDDLLTATSVAEGFRTEISDEDCSEVEILGWLYQFYISEKKDAVMARKKAVPSEDIPAVTQLFTPHWIVRYLVENSLGRLWLHSRPHSRLKEHMPYYVEDPSPAEGADSSNPQSAIPNPQSDVLTVDRAEDIRLLDPACGSGHMLTYAFDLLVKIYEEEGHAPSEIPEKILSNNLFGLEICPRAAQLAQFALVCKAREQSRAAFRRPVQPQVVCLRDVVITPEDMQAWSAATGVKLSQDELAQIHQFRENTETFGALIQPVLDVEALAKLFEIIQNSESKIQNSADLLVQNTHRKLRLVLDQAEMLSKRYQVVVANPPYLGKGGYNSHLKRFSNEQFRETRQDLYSMFIDAALGKTKQSGFTAMVTMHSWMFLSSLEGIRKKVLNQSSLQQLAHLGPRAFDSISGEVVQTVAFLTLANTHADSVAIFKRLVEASNSEEKKRLLQSPDNVFMRRPSSFKAIPGFPLAYWLSDKAVNVFAQGKGIADVFPVRAGMATGDNPLFVRQWHEVSTQAFGKGLPSRAAAKESKKKWFPFNKGGEFRKWYGNNEFVVNFQSDGAEIKRRKADDLEAGRITANNSKCWNQEFYFKPSVSWSKVGTGTFGVRVSSEGTIASDASNGIFADRLCYPVAGLLCSSIADMLIAAMNPTMNVQVGNVGSIPWLSEAIAPSLPELSAVADNAIETSRTDWDNFETSWDFRDLPLLRPGDWEVEPGQPGGQWKGRTLAESWDNYSAYCTAAIRRMQELETENNRLWIDAYGLQDELTPEVTEKEITLARADPKKDIAAFLSYAVGCMMGRYSLDHPGLILANAGDTVANYLAKVGKPADQLTFVPDEDGIIPVLDGEWFEDDIVARTRDFLRATFGPDTLNENLRFIEDSLGKDLRKYYLTDFYKDHLQTYKKRPIYWLVQSPKRGFSVLIYLHRYTKDTLNGVLNRYLRDYQVKLRNHLAHLDEEQAVASTAKAKTEARKESEKLSKILRECEDWERQVLLPLAQQRIELDLDDGVKTNYLKLAEALSPIPGLKAKND